MGSKKLTVIFLLVTLVLILAFDGLQYYKGGGEATISWVIYEMSGEWRSIPLLFGVMIGHFFLQMKGTK
jgi:hypothetical protein